MAQQFLLEMNARELAAFTVQTLQPGARDADIFEDNGIETVGEYIERTSRLDLDVAQKVAQDAIDDTEG